MIEIQEQIPYTGLPRAIQNEDGTMSLDGENPLALEGWIMAHAKKGRKCLSELENMINGAEIAGCTHAEAGNHVDVDKVAIALQKAIEHIEIAKLHLAQS
jgi:hypothetical protein